MKTATAPHRHRGPHTSPTDSLTRTLRVLVRSSTGRQSGLPSSRRTAPTTSRGWARPLAGRARTRRGGRSSAGAHAGVGVSHASARWRREQSPSESDVGVPLVLQPGEFADARRDDFDSLQQVGLRDRGVPCGVATDLQTGAFAEKVPEVPGEVRVGVEAGDGLPAVEDRRDRLHLDRLVGEQVPDLGDDDPHVLGRRNVEDGLHARGLSRRGERGCGGVGPSLRAE